jgi:hypothetical protein
MPGQDLAAVDAAIEEEVGRFMAEGPTADEIERIVTTRKADFIRGAERVGGFGGKSDILAQNEVYLGDPGDYQTTLARWQAADAEALRAVAGKWMAKGHYALEVHPFDDYTTTENVVDRSSIPTPGPAPEVRFDEFERFELSNGLRAGPPERGAGGQPPLDGQCGFRRRSVQPARNSQPGHGHARRGHQHPHSARNQRRAVLAGRHARVRVQSGRIDGIHVGAEREAGAVARPVR